MLWIGQELWDRFLSEIQDQLDTLFVIIQDKCHWGVSGNTTPMVACAINQAGIIHDNVVIVHMSATPWNFTADTELMQKFRDNVVRFDPGEGYSGHLRMSDNNHVIQDKYLPEVTKNVCKHDHPIGLLLNKSVSQRVSAETLMIVVNYCRAILGRECLKISHDVVNTLHTSNQSLVCVHVGGSKIHSAAFVQALCRCHNIMSYKFVIIDDSDHPESFPFKTYKLDKVDHTFDICAHYSKNKISFSTFIQDAGRTFGYNCSSVQVAVPSDNAYSLFCTKEAIGPGTSMLQNILPDASLKNQGVHELEDDDAQYLANDPNYIFSSECNFGGASGHYYKITSQELTWHIQTCQFILTTEPQSGKTGIKLKTTHKFVESQAAKAVVGQTIY